MTRGGLAVPIRVPLIANLVLGPRLVYGSMPIRPLDGEHPLDALLFPVHGDSIGRVTFEGLDAIKGARGEVLPFARKDDLPVSFGEWVYLIEGSSWLQERHAYELAHYEYPLADRCDHYLFSFHDEFVEAIARGIWLDQPSPQGLLSVPDDHPFLELPESAITHRTTAFGIEWELRTNPKPMDELVTASALCSQRLLQYNLILDGASRETASVWLRTRQHRSTSSFVTGFLGRQRADAVGIADESTFSAAWLSRVEGVSERRREMGLA
jgi:hypothetical protein